MPICEIRTFGGFEVALDGVPVTTFSARSAEAVLAYVASANGPVPREVLARMLWPDRPDDVARANLRSALHRLRRLLPDHLALSRSTVATSGAWTDTRALEALMRQRRLREAVLLHRGDFLEGFVVAGSPAFEAWQAAEAERYRGSVLGALEELVSCALAEGDLDGALDHGRHLLRIEPLHEPVHRALAAALARVGRRAAALAQLDACVAAVAAEVGLDPDPATLRLAASIRDGTLDGVRPAHEGERRASPTTAGSAAPNRDDHRAAVRAGGPVDRDIPRFAGPFVGREAELALVVRRLTGRECRWLTILGVGGVGKTRLAVHAAHALAAEFPDGVRFVDLDGVRSAAFVMPALAAALQLDPLPPGDPARHVAAYLRDKRVLLVIDNLEHLTDAAPTLATLLRLAPATRVLATSRTRLHLREEWLLHLDGLRDDGDAARLFAAHAVRAGAASVDPASGGRVRDICALVENLPLALELAATWTNALPLERIAASLRDRSALLSSPRADGPERHRSLAAAFEASWTLLPQPLRPLLARLGVFRGGFTVSTAASVALASEADVLALVDRSLVRARGDGRFSLHELVRQFTVARLSERAEVEATSRRHLDACLDLARTATAHLLGRDLEQGLATLGAEADNVRAALAWGLERDTDAEVALDLVEAMAPYWRLTCAIDEARAWVARAERWLERFPQRAGGVRSARGHLAWMAGAFSEAEEVLSDAVDRWDRTAPAGRVGRASALVSHGMTAWSQRRFERADARFAAALADLDGLDEPWWRAIALGWRGKTAAATGDLDAARRHFDASVEIFDALSNPWGMGLFVGSSADLHLSGGDLDGARRRAETAVAMLERVGFRHALGPLYELLALVAARAGDRDEERRRAAHAQATYRELGDLASAEAVAERHRIGPPALDPHAA